VKIKKADRIKVLIISNKFDFATDYVTITLHELKIPYLRINRDEISNYAVNLFLENEELYIDIEKKSFVISNKTLKAIYCRAPTFIRSLDIPADPENQLHKFQWASFIRNLIIFENVLWINNPVATYKSENKLYQLKIARQVGFKIPYTVVSNDRKLSIIKGKSKYAIKTLDTGLLKIHDKDAFIYTNIVTGSELKKSKLHSAPVVIQECLSPKIDIRVTVVGNEVFAVKILKQGKKIEGDWRKIKKEELEYLPVKLPSDINQRCINLVKRLGLVFGAIDLAFANGEYYFLEINPTGEWAWLVNSVNFPIHKEIAFLLSQGRIRNERKNYTYP